MISRPLALFLGAFSLLNIIGDIFRPGFDANLWWIDFWPLPKPFSNTLLAAGAVAMLAYTIKPAMQFGRAMWSMGLTAVLLAVSLLNVANFYSLLSHGLPAGFAVPLSAFIAVALAIILLAMKRRTLPRNKAADGCRGLRRPTGRSNHATPEGSTEVGSGESSQDVVAPLRCAIHGTRQTKMPMNGRRIGKWIVACVVMLVCVIGFPLAQMECFGNTDYRRPADVIVVFGAGVYADNKPSDAVADRTRTSVQLYKQGFARKLIFSGGPGAGTMHETEVMRDLAVGWGVPADDIILDRNGLSTQKTVTNTVEMFGPLGAKRVLAVSHFYHLPRVKMSYQRHSIDVYTVPAQCPYTLRGLPYFMAREVAALWAYYLQPLGDD